jgi:hypothetical protein
MPVTASVSPSDIDWSERITVTMRRYWRRNYLNGPVVYDCKEDRSIPLDCDPGWEPPEQ